MTRIHEAIGQTRRFRSKSQEALIGLMLAADRVNTTFARLLEPHDITPQQYNVLRILRGAAPQGLPTLAIVDRMIERAPGITRMIDRLEGKGLVRRERRGDDRRCVQCHITEPGLALLETLDRPVSQFDRRAMRTLDSRELERFADMLDRVRRAHEP